MDGLGGEGCRYCSVDLGAWNEERALREKIFLKRELGQLCHRELGS